MNLKEIDIKVKELIGFKDLGFYEHKNYDRNHYMFKNADEALDKVSYEFFPKVGQQELQFNGSILYSIIFPRVNQILMSVLNSHDYTDSFGSLMKPDFDDPTLTDLNDNYLAMYEFEKSNRVSPFIENGIYYEDRLVQGCTVQRKCMTQFALPFFEKFTTLRQIDEEIINKIPGEKLSSRIPGQTPFKRMIIMKLCDNSAYYEFVDALKGRLNGAIEGGMKQYQSYLEALTALDNYLESGKYQKVEDEYKSTSNVSVQERSVLPPLVKNSTLEEQFARQKKVLKDIGITFSDKLSLGDYRRDVNWQSWGMEEKEGDDLLYYLLLFSGTDVLNPLSGNDEAVSPNVYYFNAERDGFVNYGKIIDHLNLLAGNILPFTEVAGRCDEKYVGVSFRYKGNTYEWEYEHNDDWIDISIFKQFVQLVKPDLANSFYILPEGQGGLIFYFSEKQKESFEQAFPGKQLILLAEYN